MKCQRVIIEAGGGTFTLDLHPRLSVIAGLGPAERDSLIGEIIGALGGNRTGVHLELRDATGRHLAVFRPKGERHRVIDVTSAEDVSHEFVSAGSQIDLLSRSGLDANTARRFLIVGPNDFATVDPIGERITLLAAVDQRALWAAAERVTSAADDPEPELAPTDVVETPEVVDKVEELHDEFEAAVAKESQIHRLTYRIAAGTAVAAVPAAFIAPVLALPLLFATGASMAVSVVAERRIARASRAEQEALSEAGAQSYLGFHLERVNTMLSSVETRKKATAVAGDHRRALDAWRDVAGDISPEWALAHREEIIAAALLQRGASPLNGTQETYEPVEGGLAANLAHALITHLSEVRKMGPEGESLPLLLDDPFINLDPSVKPALLELLSRSAGSPQVIFLTNDPDVLHLGATRSPHRRDRHPRSGAVHRRGLRLGRLQRAILITPSIGASPPLASCVVQLRLATLDDAEEMRTIYNLEVETSTATFDLVTRSLEDQRAWLAERSGAHAAVVAVNDGEVVGFASLSPYKERAAYRTTVEDSVYVRRDHHGQGIGKALLGEMLDVARRHGFHAVMARIEATRDPSVALHRVVRVRAGRHRA